MSLISIVVFNMITSPFFQKILNGSLKKHKKRHQHNLTGKNLIQDEAGNFYVVVKRGKGGKRQEQLILPKDVPTVLDTFKNIDNEDPVFSDSKMKNLINFHGMRAQHARDC